MRPLALVPETEPPEAPAPLPRVARVVLYALVGLTLAAATLFGAVGEIPLPFGWPRIDILFPLLALTLAAGATALVALARSARLPLPHVALALALLGWAALALVPLPRGLVATISPERVALSDKLAETRLVGCEVELGRLGEQGALPLSVDPESSRRHLMLLAAALAVFLVAHATLRPDARRTTIVLAALALFASLEAFYGLSQWTADSPKVLWREKTAYLDSATGTLINRNHFAQLMYLGLGASLALWPRIGVGARGTVGRERALALRVALALAVGIQLAAAAASQSRAGFAAALVVLAFGAIGLLRRGGRPPLLLILLSGAIILPVMLLALPAVFERLLALPREWTSASGRGEVLRRGLEMFADFPLSGTGGGTFALSFGLYRPPTIEGIYNYAHNDLLEVLLESGVVGFALLALAVALVGRGVLRRLARARGDEALFAWPLAGAVVAALLHAFVDFGLRIPSNALLFALLAGAASARVLPRPSVRPRAVRALGLALAGLFALLALLALASALASWSGGATPWPKLADNAHERASDAFSDWRNQRGEGSGAMEALCASIAWQAEALERRPLSGRYASWYASRAAIAWQEGDLDPARRAEFEEAIEATVSIARTLDPWNSPARERLMRVALALGDLPGAFEDASAVVRVDAVSGRVVRQLLAAGLPGQLLARIVESEPVAYRELMAELMRDEAWATLGLVVPPEATPDRARCFAGWHVARVIEKSHGGDALAFLEACLEFERGRADELDEREQRQETVATWVAQEHFQRGEHDAARAILATLERPSASRFVLELELALAEEDWDAAVLAALELLDNRRRFSMGTWRHTRLRRQLAHAYAMQGRMRDALEELEVAQRLQPESVDIRAAMNAVRSGRSPGLP